MGRSRRVDVGGYIYHCLNRANAKRKIFHKDKDYVAFEKILEEAKELMGMNILAYCLMPNHWHLVVQTINDGDLQKFIGWISSTHAKRWHAHFGTAGQGHLYQDRYKSFLCQDDHHFLSLVRYVERNPNKADLVERSVDWKWSSLWRRIKGKKRHKKLLSPWPLEEPEDYLKSLDQPQSENEENIIEKSSSRGNPFGDSYWTEKVILEFGLESTLRKRGRPKKVPGTFYT